MKSIEVEKLPKAYFEDPLTENAPAGVLLSDVMKKYIEEYKVLISPEDVLAEKRDECYREDNTEPASYDLRLGSDCFIAGEGAGYKKLCESDPYLKIPAHGMAIVSTYECIIMPVYMIGRWNMRVGLVYHGLLWSGGPQVDPGFIGHLHFPLFNMSNTPIILKFKQHVVTIDFVKTTRVNSVGNSKWFYGDQEKIKKIHVKEIDHYVRDPNIQSAVEQISKLAEQASLRVSRLSEVFISTLSILVAVIAIMFTLPFYQNLIKETIPPMAITAIIISFIALFLSLLALQLKKTERSKVKLVSETKK